MKNSTLDALAHFSRNEKKLTDQVVPASMSAEEESPSDQTVQNILNYSKALSVRRSQQMDNVFIVLN